MVAGDRKQAHGLHRARRFGKTRADRAEHLLAHHTAYGCADGQRGAQPSNRPLLSPARMDLVTE